MKRFKVWVLSVIAAAKVDEKKVRRWLSFVGAIAATAAYQVFDVGIDAIVAMDPNTLAKRCVVCLAFGLVAALAHGGPLKAIVLHAASEPKVDPAALLAAVAKAQQADKSTP